MSPIDGLQTHALRAASVFISCCACQSFLNVFGTPSSTCFQKHAVFNMFWRLNPNLSEAVISSAKSRTKHYGWWVATLQHILKPIDDTSLIETPPPESLFSILFDGIFDWLTDCRSLDCSLELINSKIWTHSTRLVMISDEDRTTEQPSHRRRTNILPMLEIPRCVCVCAWVWNKRYAQSLKQ